MFFFKKIKGNLIPLLFLFLFTLLVCQRIVFQKEVLFTADNFNLTFPQKYFWVNEVLQGRFPLWNRLILSGTPYLADLNLGSLSVFNLAYLLIKPVELASSYLYVFGFFLIGCFMYLLGRFYKLSLLGAIVAAVAFMCSGTTLTQSFNLDIFFVVVYLPLVIYLFEKAFASNSKRLFFLGILSFSLQILSGHAQITFYSGLLLGGLIFSKRELSFKKKIKLVISVFLISGGICAVQLLPFLEFTRLTPRLGQTYQWATYGSVGFTDLLKYLFPKFAWMFVYWIDFVTKINFGYIGVVPFLLFLIGLFSRGKSLSFYKIVIIFSLIVALGKSTPFYRLIYWFVPGFSSLRFPGQAMTIYTFAAALLSGKGFDVLSQKARSLRFPEKKLKKAGKILFFLLTFFLIFSFVSTQKIFVFKDLFLEVKKFIPLPQKFTSQPFKTTVWFVNFIYLLTLTVIFLLAIVFLKSRKSLLGKTMLFTAVLLDLFLSSQAVLLTAPLSHIRPERIVEPYLKGDRSSYKIYTVPPLLAPRTDYFLPTIEESFTRERVKIMLPNQNIYFGYQALDGYASMAIASYLNQFTNASQTITGLGLLNVSEIDFRRNGVKYIIATNPVAFLDHNRDFIKITNESPFIYETVGFTPRYFIQGNGEASLNYETATEVSFTVTVYNQGKLILLDTNYPGWSVLVDGYKSTIEPYEKVYRSVKLPSGRHIVKFVFDPLSLKLGMFISLLGLCGFIILSIRSFHERIY